MRRASQLIILLDVMFIFLFILIIKPSKSTISVHFDNYINIPFTQIIATNNNNVLIFENGIWVDKNMSLASFNNKKSNKYLSYGKYRDIYNTLPSINNILLKCKTNDFNLINTRIKSASIQNLCKHSNQKYKLKTYIYDKLFDNITSQGFMKCQVKDECKNNIKIYITDKGNVTFN